MSDESAERIADAITELDNSIGDIGKALNEFIMCACTYNALGRQAIHPTFIIRKENDDEDI